MADRDVALTHAAGASNVEGGVEGVDGSKRKRVPSKKYANTQFVCEKNPSGCCPGCNLFVKTSDQGVVCFSCEAYWHYGCAGVTEDNIESLGNEEFYCREHRQNSNSAVSDVAVDNMDGISKNNGST